MLPGKKTYIAAAMTLLGFWAAYFSGEMALADAIQASVAAVLAITLRVGIASSAEPLPRSVDMKTGKILYALAPVALLLLVGCTTSPNGFPENDPRHDYDWAQTQYNKTLQNLLIMKRADEISQEDWDDTIYPLILEGDRILDQVEAAALADNATVLDVRITAFRAIYAKLVVWALVGEQGALDVGDELDERTTFGSGLSSPGDGLRGLGLGWEAAQPREPGAGQAAPQGFGSGSWPGGDQPRLAA